MSNYDSYQSNVGVAQDANKFFIKNSGFLDVEAGGTITLAAGAKITVSGNELTASTLDAMIYRQTLVQVITNSLGVLSVITIPAIGTVFYSLGSEASNASATLGDPVLGEEKLIMMLALESVGSIWITPSTGVSVLGILTSGGDISSISIRHSTVSQAFIKLKGISSTCWAVVDQSAGNITLNIE